MLAPVLDCVLDWRRDNPAASVEKVVVTANPLLTLRADRPNITAGRESQVSVQHAVAAALVTGKAGLAQFSDACVNDPRVLALRSRVDCAQDDAFPTIAAAVAITTADGKIHNLSQKAARGSELNPMSDKDLEEKLRDAGSDLESGPRYRAADRRDLEPRRQRGRFATRGTYRPEGLSEDGTRP